MMKKLKQLCYVRIDWFRVLKRKRRIWSMIVDETQWICSHDCKIYSGRPAEAPITMGTGGRQGALSTSMWRRMILMDIP